MKRTLTIAIVLATSVTGFGAAQTSRGSTDSRALSIAIDVYVSPMARSVPDWGLDDEGECYETPIQNTRREAPDSNGRGMTPAQATRARLGAGATRGTAPGALFGAIARDADRGEASGPGRDAKGSSRVRVHAAAPLRRPGKASEQAGARGPEHIRRALAECLDGRVVKF